MSTRNKKDRRLIKQETEQPAQEYSISAAFRKSPYPPPAELERYEALYPGVTKQIFDTFTTQANHRMELEKIVIQEDSRRANVAQRNSFIITMAILVLAAILFILGKDGPAIAAAITAIAPITIAFITSSITRRRERELKQKSMGL